MCRGGMACVAAVVVFAWRTCVSVVVVTERLVRVSARGPRVNVNAAVGVCVCASSSVSASVSVSVRCVCVCGGC